MIVELSVEGVALIESMQVRFCPGFNVITGETGAGKSILIRSLHFLMGGKASPEMVRKGAKAAKVIGVFEIAKTHPASIALAALGNAVEGGVTLRREMTLSGRNQAWINDQPVSVGRLREIGILLVDIFGQHENQKLLHESHHPAYLDALLEKPVLAKKVSALAQEIDQGVSTIRLAAETYLRELDQADFLRFRCDELQKFNPSLEDFNRMNDLCDQTHALDKRREQYSKILSAWDSEENLPAALKKVALELGKLGDRYELKASVLLDSVEVLTELHFELSKEASDLSVDEDVLKASEKRLSDYHELFRKNRVRGIESLVEHWEALSLRLKTLDSLVDQVDSTIKSLEGLASDYSVTAAELSDLRKKTSDKIEKQVNGELKQLSMPGASLCVEWLKPSEKDWTLNLDGFPVGLVRRWESLRVQLIGVNPVGLERARFLLRSNPGESPLPLATIASGGELSRIMLAFKKVLAADANTCVLVFDEIDSGISGRVADVVGRKIAQLAQDFQVICISHLPQVAVYARSHYLAEKQGVGDRTKAQIRAIVAKEREEEIARLLSGAELTDTSLKNAAQLLKQAKSSLKLKSLPV